MNRNRERERQRNNTGAGSRQMEQQTAGGSLQQDQGRPPTSSWMEQQGGVGHQQEQGRGGANEMPEQAGGARQQGDIDFETDWEAEEYQPEQQEGETPQGGAGAQPGSTGMGVAEARRGGGRRARKNSERDRGDPENR